MQTIEEQMHLLLEDIAPNVHTSDEQAKIIAYASSLYYKTFASKRIARKILKDEAEAHMTDAILQSMGQLNNWHETSYESGYVESYGLSSRQILSKVSQESPKWGQMEILNPDVLDYLDFNSKDEDFSELKLENAQQTSEAIQTPGKPHHRSDFNSYSEK
jgi:hypothetical protein